MLCISNKMDFPELKPIKDQAINIVVNVFSKAKQKLGPKIEYKTDTCTLLTPRAIVSVPKLKPPIAISSEKFICDVIENQWKLTSVLKYVINYVDSVFDECSRFYSFEAIFSQPTAAYPIPQTTVYVLFRVRDSYLQSLKEKALPIQVTYRIEGQHVDHDIRYNKLTTDMLLAVLMMKMKLFRRIENIGIF